MCINNNIKNTVKRLKILYNNMSIKEILKERGIVVIPISCSNISHELGHSILHPDVDTYELKAGNQYYFLNRYENQADLFTAEFLLPDTIIDNINECCWEVGDGKSIYDIARLHEVTKDLVVVKVKSLDPSLVTKIELLYDYHSSSNALNY